MNLNKIIEMQVKLDKAVEKAHSVSHDDVMIEKSVALIVELAEFANEVASFKYWKKNKQIKKDDMLEEYADCIHFYASFIANHVDNYDIAPVIKYEDINKQFLLTFETASEFMKTGKLDTKKLIESFSYFLGVGEILKFDWEEVERFYVEKNKVNFQRIANNY